MSSSDDCETDGNSEWEDQEEHYVDVENCNHFVVKCIFTGDLFSSPEDYYCHLKSTVNFDIWKIVRCDLQLNFFGYVKLINYLRTKFFGCKPPTIEVLQEFRSTWDDEIYLKPVIQDDPLLQFMVDDEDDDDEVEHVLYSESFEPSCEYKAGGNEVNDDSDITKLRKQISSLQEKNKVLESKLKDACSKISDMTSFMKDCILTGEIYRPVSACRMQQNVEEENYEDSGYFGSYSHHDIHAEMLQDQVRTCAYRDAILSNADVFKNKVVLDVGCGTGILSMFAVQAGAKQVYAVDMSEVAYHAMDIVHENKMNDKITVIKGFVEEVSLPVSKVDVIVSEWMGYFLLYESMLDSVLFASEKWLAEDGIVLPDSCEISLVAIHDDNLYLKQVQFWDNVYGFRMNCVKQIALQEASVQAVDPSFVMSDAVSVLSFSVMTISAKKLNYKANFVFSVLKNGEISAVVGYFDVHFQHGLQKTVSFSTAPWHAQTHWKQTVFFLPKPIKVQKGEKLHGIIDCHKHPKDPRSLEVKLQVGNITSLYSVS